MKSSLEHLSHLRSLFACLDHGLIVKPVQCQLGLPSIDFIGYPTAKDGAMPLPSKVAAVVDFPRPQTVRALQDSFGMGTVTVVLSPVQPT